MFVLTQICPGILFAKGELGTKYEQTSSGGNMANVIKMNKFKEILEEKVNFNMYLNRINQMEKAELLCELLEFHERIKMNTLNLSLTQKGISREDAYEMVQRNAMRVWKEGADFRELILQDEVVMKHLTENEVEECFDINWHLRHIDEIFQRVFG